MSATKYITEAATLEKKCRTWKANPRRSLGLPSSDEWARHLDGFSVPEKDEPELKRRVTQKLRASNSRELITQNSTEISDYSSSDDGGFDDVKPLDATSPATPCRAVVVQYSAKRKRTRTYLSRPDVSNQRESDVDIAADSPVKPSKLPKSDIEVCSHIEVDSPPNQRKGFTQRSFSQGSNTSEQGYSICDYESQTQTSSLDKDSPQSAKMSVTESPLISSENSSTSEGEVQQTKRRSSQWLQNLQWDAGRQTKHYDEDHPPPPLEDSAKKKKQKFCKDGLADRLQKLTRRKQSTQNVWNHRMATAQHSLPDVSKSLVVEMLSTQWQFSMLVCRCREVPSDPTPDLTVHWGSQQTLTVFFATNTVNRLGLKIGSVVQIYPPWQSFDSLTEGKVVLCTLFCHLFPSQGGTVSTGNVYLSIDKEEEPNSNVQLKVQTIATWNCPCLQDGTFPRNSCQAQLEPSHTDLSLRVSLDTRCLSVGSPVCRLHTEILSQTGSQVTTGILESIENQGGFGACGIALVATVQRVFYRNIVSNSSEGGSRPSGLAVDVAHPTLRVGILLQDKRGTCCEVTLPPRSELLDTWQSLSKEGEGKVWSFNGLRQHCRTNRNRDPSLFHIIDSVSPSEGVSMPDTSSQSDSQQSQQRHVGHTMQAFCYRLLAPSGESACKLVGPAPIQQPSVFYQLADIDRVVSRKPRITVICKIIFNSPQEASGVNRSQHWYVMDSSLSPVPDRTTKGYYKVRIQPTCWLSPAVLEELRAPQPVVVLKDVLLQDGQYICDGYSRLYPSSSVQSVADQLTLYSNIPDVHKLRKAVPVITDIAQLCSISTDDLVTISGVITGVNENTAYTWDVCGHCNSSDLQSNPAYRHGLYCRGCSRTMKTPETRINLEVYTHIQTILQSKPIMAKVKLLQPTIEGLLPDETTDEGYDVQCVLGKELGPLLCVVTGTIRTSSTKDAIRDVKEVQLQQVTPKA